MSGLSKLHEAIKNGDINAAMTLISDGVDVNAIYCRETAFTQAMEAGRYDIAVRIMTHASFKPNTGNQFNRTPLFSSAVDGNRDIASALLAMGADVDACDIRGVTPLGATAWYDHHEVAQLLIDHGADVNKQEDTGESPLFRACDKVSVNVARVLLDNGADVNMKTFENNSCPNFTPLMASIPSKYELEIRHRKMTEMIGLLKTILSTGSDINAVQKHGMSALHVAVDRNEVYGACVLADHGCDLELRDSNGLTAFHRAIQPDRPLYEIALYLLIFGADVNTRFLDTTSGTKVLPLTMVLKARPDTDLVKKQRSRLLHALVPATDLGGMNVFEVIEAMLEDTPVCTEDFNIRQEYDVNQPAILQRRCRLVLRKLLGQYILPSLEFLPLTQRMKNYLALEFDYKSYHPLDACGVHVSIADNELAGLKDLLEKGCNVDIPLADMTPLTLAAQTGNVEAVKVLLEFGAEPSRLDGKGQSALHVAAANGKDAVIDVLVATMLCDVNSKDADGNTPLQEAANQGHFNTVIKLINHGAKSSIIGGNGVPSLHLAAGSGHFKAVECILGDREDVNRADVLGNTPLHVASSRGLIYLRNMIRLPALYTEEVLEIMDSVKLTLNSGLPQYMRKDGLQHREVVGLLLKGGADESIINRDGMLAVEYATKYFRDALDLFSSYPSGFD